MGRAVSSAQLQIRVDIAKKREAARLAKKLATEPKPYAGKEPTTEAKAQSVTDKDLFVAIPVITKNWEAIPAGTKTALGVTLSSAALPASAALVGFEGNHKTVARVVVHEGLSTPTAKNTAWGTRVVKMTAKSWSFPAGNDDLGDLITAFRTQFGAGGAARALLGTKNGFAELRIGKQVLVTVK